MHTWNVLHTVRSKYKMQKLCKKSKSSAFSTVLCTTLHNFVGLYLSNYGMYWQWKKNLLNSNISSTCPYNTVNFRPLMAEIGQPVWGTPANFNGFRTLTSLLHRCCAMEVNQTLPDVWPSPGLVCYIYILGGSCPLTEFYQVQNSLCPCPRLEFSYIGSITAWHSNNRRQPNFAAWYKDWNYGTFAAQRHLYLESGHHAGHRPTFCCQATLPSNRHHWSNGDCLEGKREYYQVCSLQYCVQQLYTVQCTHIWTDLTVLWIGFRLTGPISLCLDAFLYMYCVSLYITCMCRTVTC